MIFGAKMRTRRMNTLSREECKAELVRRLRTLRVDSERGWGRMTAHQMVCHLADACRMALGQQPVSDASTLLTRTIVKVLALYLPLQWRPGIVTRPEIDQYVGGTKPVDFTSDVERVEALLNTIAARGTGGPWPMHPVFGRMSHAEWLRWAYLHTDHHLRQFGV
jgi:uncharacterized protein DUF1569